MRLDGAPFWQRLPAALAYPARPPALWVVFGLAAVGAVSYRPGPWGGILQVALFILLLRYAYAAMLRAAAGRDDPPAISLRLFNSDLEMALKQFGVIILFAMLYSIGVRLLGAAGGVVVLAVANLAAPATAMVIALENSFLRAVNPLLLWTLVRRIGTAYLVLCLLLAALWLLAQLSFDLLSAFQHHGLQLFFYDLCAMYFLLAMAYLMGCALWQYRERLALDWEHASAP
jgi:hypothetical protein